MEKTPISKEVIAVCELHFNGLNSGCATCPLRQACHSGPTANLTYERMEEWRQRLNAAARTGAPNE